MRKTKRDNVGTHDVAKAHRTSHDGTLQLRRSTEWDGEPRRDGCEESALENEVNDSHSALLGSSKQRRALVAAPCSRASVHWTVDRRVTTVTCLTEIPVAKRLVKYILTSTRYELSKGVKVKYARGKRAWVGLKSIRQQTLN